MLAEEKISARQLFVLALLFSIGDAAWHMPTAAVSSVRQDAWIAGLIALGAGLLFVVLYHALCKLYAGETFVQFTERTFGKWLGITVSLLFFCFTFTLSAMALRSFAGFIITAILPQTPIQFLNISFIAVVILGTKLGIEVIARTAEILLPYAFFMVIIINILLIPQIEVTKIQPVFEAGMNTVFLGTISIMANPYLELAVFLVILSGVKLSKQSRKALVLGTFIGGGIVVLYIVLSVLVLGVEITERQAYPTYTLAKKVNIGNFLERLEIFLTGSIFVAIFIKLTLGFYASAVSLAQILRLRDYRPLIFPLGIIVVVYSIIMYPNSAYAYKFAGQIYPYFAATFGLLLPAALFVTTKLRKKRILK